MTADPRKHAMILRETYGQAVAMLVCRENAEHAPDEEHKAYWLAAVARLEEIET